MSVVVKGLQNVFSKLQKMMNLPVNEITQELAEEAKGIIDSAYATAISPGNNEWNSYVEPYKKGSRIIVEGHDVGFLEFGTGIETEPDEFAKDMPYPVMRGSWSATHERQYVDHGGWYYGGEYMKGTAPTRGMHLGLEHIRQNANIKAKGKVEKWIKGN